MKVTIIIPTYNERENIVAMISAINDLHLPNVSILVVDDNSPDKTYEAVKDAQRNAPNLSLLLREKKEGLGKAYINAFEKIIKDGNSEAIIMMDADFSHNPKYLPLLIKESENADVVIGSRYVRGGGIEKMDIWRRLLSKFANFYAKKIIGLPVFDCTAGFILIKKEFLCQLDLKNIMVAGYAFLIELKSLLWKSGARIKEVPIILDNRAQGKSKMNGKIILEGVFAPWRIRKKICR
jgi:dolichol-phosphate mannosyltransferase